MSFHVLAKNLVTSKMSVFNASELLEVTDDFKFSPFKPSSPTDFVSKKEYGRVHDDRDMVRYYVIAMEETAEKLKKKMEKGRLSAPIRKSLTAAKHPLSLYSAMQEKETAKTQQTASTTSKAASRSEANKNIVAQFKEKTAETPLRKKVMPAAPLGNPNVSLNQEATHTATKPATEPAATKSTATTSAKDCVSAEPLKQQSAPQEKFQKSSVEEECNCAKSRRLERELQCALQELEIMRTREMATDNSNAILAEVRSLTRELSESVKEEISKIPELLQHERTTSSGKCSLETLVHACQEKSSSSGVDVPSGMVHVGEGTLIKKSSIVEVERESWKFTKRVNMLCEQFWPDKCHLFSLSPNEPSLNKISDSHVSAMKNLLNSMAWDMPGYCVTESTLREQIRRYTYNVREKFKERSMTEEEKKKAKEEKELKKMSVKAPKKKSAAKESKEQQPGEGECELLDVEVDGQLELLTFDIDTAKDLFSGYESPASPDATQFDGAD